MPENHSGAQTYFSKEQLSDEQRTVVSSVVDDRCNVIVNAVAGSGKTRTGIVAAIEWVSSHILTSGPTAINEDSNHCGYGGSSTAMSSIKPAVLILAYNRRLMEDTQEQARNHAPPHVGRLIEVRTIHGFGKNYFGGSGRTTDRELYNWVHKKAKPIWSIPSYSLVVIDEAQDMIPILVDFLHYVLSQLNRPQLIILGDPFQLLYRFKGADESFIFKSHEMFADVAASVPFKRFKLSICFRITKEMAVWINQNLNPNKLDRAEGPDSWCFEKYRQQIADWWGDGIKANPHCAPAPGSVTFCNNNCRPGRQVSRVERGVIDVLEKFDADSFSLLSNSIKKGPARTLMNKVKVVSNVKQSWIVDSGKDTYDYRRSDVRRNKRVASSVHKFKGRECDAVVLVGFDGYLEKSKKRDPRDLFNMYYVAATRARKRLHIIQWYDTPFATQRQETTDKLSELNSDLPCKIPEALNYCGYDPVLCEKSPSCLSSRNVLSLPKEDYQFSVSARNDYVVPGSHHPDGKETFENVSEIIGRAVRIRLQLILDENKLWVPSPPKASDEFPIDKDLKKFLEDLKNEAASGKHYSWAELMKIATAFLTLDDKFLFRWRQVRNFSNWPIVKAPEQLDVIVRNLIHLLYVTFYVEGTTGEVNLGGGLTQKEVSQIQTAGWKWHSDRVESLRKIRKEGLILFCAVSEFWMGANRAFVQSCAKSLLGVIDIAIISQEEAEKWKKRRKYEAAREALSKRGGKTHNPSPTNNSCTLSMPSTSDEEVEQIMKTAEVKKALYDAVVEAETSRFGVDGFSLTELMRLLDGESGITLVGVKVTSDKELETDHDHLLEMGCYGAMLQNQGQRARRDSEFGPSGLLLMDDCEIAGQAFVESQPHCRTDAGSRGTNQSTKMPKLLLVYPNPSLGSIWQVRLGMDTKEYLHRVGCRKINVKFDPTILETPD